MHDRRLQLTSACAAAVWLLAHTLVLADPRETSPTIESTKPAMPASAASDDCDVKRQRLQWIAQQVNVPNNSATTSKAYIDWVKDLRAEAKSIRAKMIKAKCQGWDVAIDGVLPPIEAGPSGTVAGANDGVTNTSPPETGVDTANQQAATPPPEGGPGSITQQAGTPPPPEVGVDSTQQAAATPPPEVGVDSPNQQANAPPPEIGVDDPNKPQKQAGLPPSDPGPIFMPPIVTVTSPPNAPQGQHNPPQGSHDPPQGTHNPPGHTKQATPPQPPPSCNTKAGVTTCTDRQGHKCTSKTGSCDPSAPQTANTQSLPVQPVAPQTKPAVLDSLVLLPPVQLTLPPTLLPPVALASPPGDASMPVPPDEEPRKKRARRHTGGGGGVRGADLQAIGTALIGIGNSSRSRRGGGGGGGGGGGHKVKHH